jgi:hypothetical protein
LEKSDKLPKLLICPDLAECEFRLAWLYGKIQSFHTSSIWTWFEIKEKKDLDMNSN